MLFMLYMDYFILGVSKWYREIGFNVFKWLQHGGGGRKGPVYFLGGGLVVLDGWVAKFD
jgi:hypothetical protein